MAFWGKRVSPPLYVSLQTRSAEAIGALSFAFQTPWRTPAPLTGTGVYCGSFQQEAGHQIVQLQNGAALGYGGLFTGTYAQQPLVDTDYLTGGAT